MLAVLMASAYISSVCTALVTWTPMHFLDLSSFLRAAFENWTETSKCMLTVVFEGTQAAST